MPSPGFDKLWRRELGHYGGMIMRCAPGTHEAAAKLLLKRVGERPAVLDLAAGSGAFLARLREGGFTDLDAVEIDAPSFKFPGVKPRFIDLNSDFSNQIERRFGLVTALEILEHLDCPRHFLREIHGLLNPGGYLLFSTPNIANWTGRLRFLLSGEQRQFRESDYHFQRHISPTTDVQMRLMLKEIGFELVDATVAGSFFGPLKMAVLSPVILPAALLWGRLGVYDVRIYLAQRVEPDKTSRGATSFYFRPAAES
jgi:SAM-dependent methyltransferase